MCIHNWLLKKLFMNLISDWEQIENIYMSALNVEYQPPNINIWSKNMNFCVSVQVELPYVQSNWSIIQFNLNKAHRHNMFRSLSSWLFISKFWSYLFWMFFILVLDFTLWIQTHQQIKIGESALDSNMKSKFYHVLSLEADARMLHSLSIWFERYSYYWAPISKFILINET